MKKTIGKMFIALINIIVLVAIDQITKIFAVANLKDADAFVLIDNVLEFYYLENTGAAFSLLEGGRIFFLIITVLIVGLCCFFYIKLAYSSAEYKFFGMRIALVLLISGAIGNFIDRIRHGYVVDFIYFKPINFPVFNVADIYVSLAAVLLCVLVIFVYKDADFKEVFRGSNE